MIYKLRRRVLAVFPDSTLGRDSLVYIPAGARVTTVPDDTRAQFVAVVFRDRRYFLFLADLEERANRVEETVQLPAFSEEQANAHRAA